MRSKKREGLTDPRRGERLELVVDPTEYHRLGSGSMLEWAPPGRTPYYNLALQPCVGAPDDLMEAVESGTARTLSPGEECRWGVEVWLPDEAD